MKNINSQSQGQKNRSQLLLRRSYLLILCTLISWAAQAQYTLTDDDVVVTDGVITSYSSTETDIIIPNMLDGQVITGIGEEAFREKGLVNVDLSDLTNLTIIEESAFRDNSITSVDFTDLGILTNIGRLAFYENSLTTVDFTPLTNLTTIGYRAFRNNSISSIDLAGLNNLTTIGDQAFSDNNIDEFVLPSPLLEGEWRGTDDVVYASGTTVSVSEGYFFTNDALYTLTSDDVVVENGEIISVNLKMTYPNIVIPSNLDGQDITAIGSYTFDEHSLVTVDLSALINLTTIGEAAFDDNQLTSIDFTGLTNLTIIGESAFSGNDISSVDFTSLTNLKTIGERAFSINDISSVDFTGLTNLVTIGSSVFVFTDTDEFALPNPSAQGVWRDAQGASYSSGDIVRVPGAYFYTNDALYTLTSEDVVVEHGKIISVQMPLNYRNIVIPNVLDGQEVIAIGESAFIGKLLSSVDLSSLTNLKEIEAYAFYNNSLTTIDLSDLTNLTTIDDGALAYNSLTTIDLSDLSYLTTIGSSAFSNNSLTSIDLSDLSNLIAIGSSAFNNNSIVSFLLPTPLPEGYNSSGWIDNMNEYYENGESVDELARSYKAVVERLVYTITYHVDGGSHDNLLATYSVVDEITFTSAAKENYMFDGWFTDVQFTTEITNIEKGSTGNLNLYAKFDAIAYDITYHIDGGAHDNPATYTIEDAVTFAAATKDGFEFEGWYTDEKFTTEITEIAKGSTGEVALYAKFTKVVLSLFDSGQVDLTLYPNPVTHSFSVDATVDQINVLNLDGQLVHTYMGNQVKYDVSQLAPGHYIVQLIKAHKTLGAQQVIINSGVR
ncbi:MAG: leucine-rich repeat protein [Reichenbachiella sp.]|uniref:leucine-rich repeat protein n=1 Tax=Reichenbachiella sp. TaxID=2184521 RepID=UPI003298A1D5